MQLYQYPDGSERLGLPQAVQVDGVNLYTSRMTAGDLYFMGYKRILDVTEIPAGQQRADTYVDTDTGERIERAYDLEAIPMEELVAPILAAIQAEKVRARDAGFEVNGVLFDSDSEARVAYLELAGKLAANPGYSTSWKASAGLWVDMDAALYAQVAAAGEAHISAVFGWQASREAEVAAAVAAEDAAALAAVGTRCE